MLSTKSTLSQKLKVENEVKNPFQNRDEHFIQEKLKIVNYHIYKSENGFFIRFRTLRNFLDQKIKTALLEEGGGGGSACH